MSARNASSTSPEEPNATELSFRRKSVRHYSRTMAVSLTESGRVTWLTDDDVRYDEPEGAVPGGKWTLVESDHQHRGEGSTHIDIWKVALDGSDDRERVTYFNEEGVFKGTNPVVSDDGRYMAFQVPKVAQIAGVGSGIYIMDLAAAGH